MKMKFVIAAAVAVLCVQSANADAGFTAAQAKIAQAVASGKVLKLSGASAMNASIRAAFAKTCVGNAIDAWFINPANLTNGTGNFNLYVCTGKNLSTTNFGSNPFFTAAANNAQVLIVSHAGSASSLQGAVGADVTLLQTSLAGCNITTIGSQTVQAVAVPVYGSCTTSATQKSIGGFSDVERDLFQSVITAGNLPGVTDSNLGNVETTASFGGQAFSVITSRPLYRALQAAQGITTADCLDDTVTLNAAGTAVTAVNTLPVVAPINDFTTPRCQPSITKQQYATLIASQNAESIGLASNPWATLNLPDAPVRNVRLARRDDISGTQAASNAYFLNQNCANGPHGGEVVPTAASSGQLIVTLNTGTGAVLTAVNSGELTGTKGTANEYVIGVVSSENVLRTAGTFDSFGFLKINGVSPTEDAKQRQSAVDGRYDFAMEFVLHTSSTDASVPKDFAKLLNDLIGGDPSDADSPDLAGVYTLPLGFTNAAFPTRVSKGTKGGNNCSPVLNAF